MTKKAKKTNKNTVQFSVTFSIATAEFINDILPKYRNNRSLAVETFVTASPEYKKYVDSKK